MDVTDHRGEILRPEASDGSPGDPSLDAENATLSSWRRFQLPRPVLSGAELFSSPRMRRLAGPVAYLLAQGLEVAGLITPRYPDSATYLQLSFTGQTKMLPTIPLVYTVLGSDPLRVLFQVLFATFAWWTTARIASSAVVDRRVGLGLRLVILLLGLVGPIASWNSVILSESIAISLTVLLAAYWMRYALSPSASNAIAPVVVTVLWIFARQAHVVLGLLVTATVVIAALATRRRVTIVLAAALCLASVYGVAIVGRDPNQNVSVGNVSDTIQDRILPNPGWTAWFQAHGMPYNATIAAAAGGPYGTALQNNPQFFSWLTTNGTHDYLLFVLTHPVYTFWDPLPSFTGELASLNYNPPSAYPSTQPEPTVSMLSPSATWGRHRQILPTVLEELLFQQGQAGDVLGLAAIALFAAFVARRRLGPDRRMLVPGIVVLSAVPQGYFVWLGGGEGEADRLSMVLAVSVRVGLWVVLALALDRLVRARYAPKETITAVAPLI